ncbi:Fis family transcriptional regulator [Hydrogenimonas sp.]
MVAVQVAATNFIAVSKPLREALKSANLLKSLKLNTLISGEKGTGRHSLAKVMMPDVPIFHGDDPALFQLMANHSRCIVDRFEKIEHPPKFFQFVQKHGKHVVAIAEDGMDVSKNSFFSVRLTLPSLVDRPEDIPPLTEKFKKEVFSLFGEGEKGISDFEVDMERLDIRENAFSLRKSIVLQYLSSRIDEDEILAINEAFIGGRMESEEDLYRKMLYLYEVPLIRAGTKRYGSQLKMSKAFGLNRNTLKKKITEWRRYF